MSMPVIPSGLALPSGRAQAQEPPASGALTLRTPAWMLTAAFGVAYLIAAPPSGDLAAATYRSDLFARVGLGVWDNGWYDGHHLPAYSLLAPALGWLLGPRLLAVLSLIAASALFSALIRDRFPPPAQRLAALWFALGAAVALLSCRVAFDLGLAAGLAALVAAQRGWRWRALSLAALCSIASPVAGGFLALAALAWALAARPARLGVALVAAALAPLALLALAFPEGGSQPYVASAFYPVLAVVLTIAAVIAVAGSRRLHGPATQLAWSTSSRVLATGALLYAGALIAAYVAKTPLGGNVNRLGALIAGPVAACVLAGGMRGGWRAGVLLALSAPLLYWQANAPAADFASATSDPAVNRAYYTPLLAELQRLGIGYEAHPARIEVVPTADHWEAAYLAPHVALARGWERQLDNARNAIFYRSSLTISPQELRAWLLEEGISYVALPDAPLDYSGRAEGRLLRASPPSYLRPVWSSRHWRLFAVRGAAPLAQRPASLTQLGSDSFTLRAPRAGTYTVRVRFTPYWALAEEGMPAVGGCVSRAPEGWTTVQTGAGGRFHVVIDFAPDRMFNAGPRCTT